MKKIIFQIALVAISILGTSNLTIAQTLDATLEYRVSLVALALEADGYTLANYDLAILKKGEKYEGATTCHQGYEYTVIALGAGGVEDIDLYIYESNGRLVTYTLENNDIGVTALTYTMNRTDDIKIMAKNYDSKNPYKGYQVVFLVAYKPNHSKMRDF